LQRLPELYKSLSLPGHRHRRDTAGYGSKEMRTVAKINEGVCQVAVPVLPFAAAWPSTWPVLLILNH